MVSCGLVAYRVPRGRERSDRRLVTMTRHLAAKDAELMTEHSDLDVLLVRRRPK